MQRLELARALWAAYLDRHFAFDGDGAPTMEHATPETLARLIWPFLSEVAARAAFLRDARSDPAFDGEADAALVALAEKGDLSAWDGVSAGALATLNNRATWAVAALTMEEAGGGAFTVPLPLAAPERVRATAALLFLLAGPASSPPSEWRAGSTGGAPGFPPQTPFRRH